MRILLTTHCFAPSVGGIETVSQVLAEAFAAAGHEVTVATQTPGDPLACTSYVLLRRPSPRRLTAAARRADVVLQNQISLRLGWTTALLRRPCVVAHHMWTARSGPGGLNGRLKHLVYRHVHNIAVSHAMAASLEVASTVVPNPYDESVFNTDPGAVRERDLVFLGRLQPGKGLHVLLAALGRLRTQKINPTLTVIGTGPEHDALRSRADALGVGSQVHFAGIVRGEDLARMLNRHRLLVVPSIWEEPFGVVALEGLACGLVPIVSDAGGLPDAVGDCGQVVRRDDPTALAEAVATLLADHPARMKLMERAPAHLRRHTPRAVASAYLDVLEKAAGNTAAPDGPSP